MAQTRRRTLAWNGESADQSISMSKRAAVPQIFDDLIEDRLRMLLINLGGSRREVLPHRFLRCLHQHGDEAGGESAARDRPQPLVVVLPIQRALSFIGTR